MDMHNMPFSKMALGYDPEQVDKYFKKLTGEYDSLYQKYNELSCEHDVLTRQSADSRAIIAKVLIDSEEKASQIIAEARTEAARIIKEAHDDLLIIQNERDRIINNINDILEGLKATIQES